ncbi:AAA family ATPase, partial [Chloroflexota bacterium]
MVALYITSLERGSGKTTVCAGLGKHLLNDGKKTGFFKPIIADSKNIAVEDTDSDATFIKNLFALEEPLDLLCPIFSNESDLAGKIKDAYARVSKGKDVVIIEGISEQHQASHDIVETLNAKVIIVEGYSQDSLKAIEKYNNFGKHLLGIVLNKVPGSQVERVSGEIS